MERVEEIKQVIVEELPDVIEREPEVRASIVDVTREHFADKRETEDRFERLLEESRRRWEENQRELRAMREEFQNELRAMREEQERRWEEDRRRWEENQRRWEENQRQLQAMREEQERRWEENQRRWEENQRQLQAMREEQERRWEENQRRWEKNQRELRALREEQERRWKALLRKYDQGIGALGARWGIQTEETFRNALAGILGDLFGIQVTRYEARDEEGVVFGRPAQVEIDLIVTDGQLVVGEIKSSISYEEMQTFWRKAKFYEEKHGRQADRLVVISPMVEPRARKVAEELGIEVYSYAEDAGAALTNG